MCASGIDSSDGTLICNTGCLYLRRGDKESARTWWRRRLLDSPAVDERRRAEELLREVDGKAAVQ